ncbi:MAG: class I SAM-dependent methyltransferase [Jatrophihabitantaceae bacterium]
MATDSHDPAGSSSIDRVIARGIAPLLWSRLLRICHEQTSNGPVTVLDCGGGSGSLAVPLAGQGALVTVVDLSIDALATLLRRSAEAGVSDRVTAVQGDVEALSDALPTAEYDLVLAHGLLENLPNPAEAIAQIAAVLRPGGVASLVIANPVAAVLGRLLAGDVAAALDNFHRSAATGYDLTAATSQSIAAGLIVESVEGVGMFTDLVPGIQLDRPGVMRALAELEAAAASTSPYRDIAGRLHLVARRPMTASG